MFFYGRKITEFAAGMINAGIGKAIKGAKVIFNINGVKTALKTDNIGQVRIIVANFDLGVN